MKLDRFKAVGRRIGTRWVDAVLALALFIASLALYIQTLAPSVAALFDDSLEFPLVIHRLGIAHPTGYPLYTLLGKLFTLGSPDSVARSVNLFSAVAAALTVALIYLVARQLTRRRLPAMLGALTLALSPIFWSQAVVAEVYALNSAFVAGLLWLTMRWARQPLLPVNPFSLVQLPPKDKPPVFLPGEGFWGRVPLALRQAAYWLYATYRRFFPAVSPSRRLYLHPLVYALVAVFGLSLTHHRTIVLLIPALFLFALLVERRVFSRAALLGPEYPERRRWLQFAGRPIVLLVLCVLLPLLLYLYLPIRGNVGSLDGTYENTWRGFWQWVTTGGYNVFLGDNPLARDLDAAFYAGLFWQQFGPVGLALAILGVFGLARKPKALALTGVGFLTYTLFAIVYRVPDVEVFFIPAFLFVALWIATGLDYVADLLRIRGPSLALRRVLAAALLSVFLLATIQPLAIAGRNYPDLDFSRRWIVHDFGQYVLRQEMPADSTVVGLLGEVTLLRYFQETTGLGADVGTVAADLDQDRRQAVEAAQRRGEAAHITRPLPGVEGENSLGSVIGILDVAGDLETVISVGEPAYEAPALPRQVDQEMADGLVLLGYGVHEHQAHWQAFARLRLWWQAPEGVGETFKVSARLLDARGQLVAATDAEPVAGAYSPESWRPGEVVADAYEIELPAGLPPGAYTPLVIVYDPATGSEHGRVELAPVALQGNPARPPQRGLEASVAETPYTLFGDVELLGFTPPDPAVEYHPGDTLPLVLLWQARGMPAGDLSLTLWLEGDYDYPLAEEPLGGLFATEYWQDGQTVRQWPAPIVPDNAPPGSYHLKIRVTRDGQPVPYGRWFLPLGSDLDLGPVRVGP